MFKKVVTASLTAATMTASAYAADLPARHAVVVPPPPPVYSWTGCYVGANGGGAWVSNSGWGNNTNSNVFVETVGTAVGVFPVSAGVINNGGNNGLFFNNNRNNNNVGAFGGGQIGCNLQAGMFVFGGELDAQGSRISSTGFGSAVNAFGGLTSIATTQRIDYFGTARVRAGITFGGFGSGYGGPGGWGFGGPVLLYVTGGFAYAGLREGFASNTTIPLAGLAAVAFGPAITLNAANLGNNGRVGFAAGGGIEWMFLPNWSVKGEYQFIGLRAGPVAAATEIGPLGGTPFVITRRDPAIGIHTARIGLNYHFFSAPAAPVVARY